jgi:serine protease Do
VRLLCLLLVFPLAASAAVSRGFNRLLDSVVCIEVTETSYDRGSKSFSRAIGSGVILTDDGLVLTNAHVVNPHATEVSVTLASLEKVEAKLVGWDHWTDLAVLQLDRADVKKRKLTFNHADFGDSDDLFPGETVYAVGTPFGLTRTVTRGIISNNRRYFEADNGVDGYETGLFNTWLQTDAAINPGNSGGPLVTEDGRVIGINARGDIGANELGFAIPANVAKIVVAGLTKDGSITRSYLGLQLDALEQFDRLKQKTGVLISGVDRGSPAAKAGLKQEDILLAIDGKAVDGRFPEQLPPIQNLIASRPVGSIVKLRVLRRDVVTEYFLATEILESAQGEEAAYEKWGLTVRKVSRAYAREHQLDDATGLLVVGVQPGFPAAVAGLGPRDVIVKINEKPIDALPTAEKIYDDYVAKPRNTLLEVWQNHEVELHLLKP